MGLGQFNATSAERELVIRAQAGDVHAAGELFVRFWRAARAAAYAVVRDMANAEDAAAEAFRVALPRLGRLRDPDRFGPWLRRIVRRVARRESTRSHSDSESLDHTLPATTPDPALSLERREMALLVSQAVERLPAAEREAVVLYYFEGYAGDEAAKFLDIPVGIPPSPTSRRPHPTPPAADQNARDSRRRLDRARAPAGARPSAAFDRRAAESMVRRHARTPAHPPYPVFTPVRSAISGVHLQG